MVGLMCVIVEGEKVRWTFVVKAGGALPGDAFGR